MRRLALWAIRGYQRLISPLLPSACRFYPTCSEYAYLAIERHGLIVGSGKAAWRLLRCNPWNPGGFDPVDPADRDQHERAVAALAEKEEKERGSVTASHSTPFTSSPSHPLSHSQTPAPPPTEAP